MICRSWPIGIGPTYEEAGRASRLDRLRARYCGNAPDQHRQSSAPSKRGQVVYRFRNIGRRTKDLYSKEPGVSEARTETGRLSRPSQGFSEPCTARREIRRI